MAAGKMVSIEEIRQTLHKTRALYQNEDAEAFNKDVDAFITRLRSQYTDQVPAADAVKLLREFQPTQGAPHKASPVSDAPRPNSETVPDGVICEWKPDGFVLHVSNHSWILGVFWFVFAGAVAAAPVVMSRGELVSGFQALEGPTFWVAGVFLVAWTCGVLYVASIGAMNLFGEVRIAKVGGDGEIFTGIGRIGRTRKVQWTDYDSIGEKEVIIAYRHSSSTKHFVALTGPSHSYRFGSELRSKQRTFVIAFLRRHVFGLQETSP